MKLEDIGFYTLSDERAENVSPLSPMMRGEIILTNECNLKCIYCRELAPEINHTIKTDIVKYYIDVLAKHVLQNIRFSGGEPTLHPCLNEIIKYSKENNVKRIALSTNGTADIEVYKRLIKDGVNDFSISLDGGCCAINTKMCGGYESAWEKASKAIEILSRETYVTVGIVLNEINIESTKEILNYVIGLKPSDIRIIPSAQYNILRDDEKYALLDLLEISKDFPILNYRINQIANTLKTFYKVTTIRGRKKGDTTACPLVLDDIAIAGYYHFPCIIYLREGGYPIGQMRWNFREERVQWFKNFEYVDNKICRENCLDVCIAYNNKVIKNYDDGKNFLL